MISMLEARRLKRMREEMEARQRAVDRRDAGLASQWPNYGSDGSPNYPGSTGAGRGGDLAFSSTPSATDENSGSPLSPSCSESSGSPSDDCGGGE